MHSKYFFIHFSISENCSFTQFLWWNPLSFISADAHLLCGFSMYSAEQTSYDKHHTQTVSPQCAPFHVVSDLTCGRTTDNSMDTVPSFLSMQLHGPSVSVVPESCLQDSSLAFAFWGTTLAVERVEARGTLMENCIQLALSDLSASPLLRRMLWQFLEWHSWLLLFWLVLGPSSWDQNSLTNLKRVRVFRQAAPTVLV